MWKFGCALLVTYATAASAHDFQVGSPFDQEEGWRTLGPSASGNAVAFVLYSERVGSAVLFETLVTFREPQLLHHHPQSIPVTQRNEHYLADCQQGLARVIATTDFAPADSPPPPINIAQQPAVPPPANSMLAAALEYVCSADGKAWEPGVIPNTVAEEYFAASSGSRK